MRTHQSQREIEIIEVLAECQANYKNPIHDRSHPDFKAVKEAYHSLRQELTNIQLKKNVIYLA